MLNRLVYSEPALFSGDGPVLANLAELGMKPEWTLMLKIHGPSSGVVTRLNGMLSSMNFEEVAVANLGIDVSHLLRWLDRYPVRVEIKGSSKPLVAEKIWITSNIEPRRWYPDLDPETLDALMRRLEVTEFE